MADLTTYAGRAKRRPPGASDFTQRLYRLLYEHPEGMTRDEIHEILREGWMDTDAYRAYERCLEVDRRRHRKSTSGRQLPSAFRNREPVEFQSAAQRWWIYRVLKSMKTSGSATVNDGKWHVGRRAPNVQGQTTKLVPFDPVESRAVHTSTTAEHVQREKAKETALTALKDGRIKGRSRELFQLIYDQLSGRA